MSAYRPKNFILQELVMPEVYQERGERAWELLDARALLMLQMLRHAFGPIVVNNWHDGGEYKESGLRSFECSTGAKLSQHKFGRAFDCKSRNATPYEMRDFVIGKQERFPYLTTIEDPQYTPTWFHFDTRLHHLDKILIVKP